LALLFSLLALLLPRGWKREKRIKRTWSIFGYMVKMI
jgi:hypothetical protein